MAQIRITKGVRGSSRQEEQHVSIPAGTIRMSPPHLDSQFGNGSCVGREVLAPGVVNNNLTQLVFHALPRQFTQYQFFMLFTRHFIVHYFSTHLPRHFFQHLFSTQFPRHSFQHQFSTQFHWHLSDISFPLSSPGTSSHISSPHTSPGTFYDLSFSCVCQAPFPTSVFSQFVRHFFQN